MKLFNNAPPYLQKSCCTFHTIISHTLLCWACVTVMCSSTYLHISTHIYTGNIHWGRNMLLVLLWLITVVMKCVIIYQDFFLVNARDWSIFIMCNKIFFSLTNLHGPVSSVPAIAIIKLDLSRSQPDKKLPDQKFQKPPSFNPSTLTPSSVFYTFVAVLWQIKHIITIVPSILSLPHNTPFINPATIASSDNQCFQLLKLNGIYSFVFVLKTNYCPIDARLLALKPWKLNWVEQCPPSAVRCYPVFW